MNSRVSVLLIRNFFHIDNRMVLMTMTGLRKFNSIKIFPSRPNIKKQLTMDSLPDNRLPIDIIEYESGKDAPISVRDKLNKWENNKSSMRLNESNYIESFRLMIHLEEAAEQVQLEKSNQKNVKLHHLNENEFYFFVEPKMKNLYALTKQFDEFVLHSKDGTRITDGQIVFKENNKIFVDLKSTMNWSPDHLYDLVFRYNRTFYLLQHQALDFVRNHKLFDLLIDNPNYHSILEDSRDTEYSKDELKLSILKDLNLNDEQKEAVVNITGGQYHPLPYLVYGPAGTGKTKTLIAAILRIVETSDENVLVCTQSNAACDEITVRLKEYLDETLMFRIYTKSKDMDEITKSILSLANYFGDELKFPPLKYIYRYRVVICTLATAGCLSRAHCNPHHFSYVIIDECASAVETITLVPIVGLCTTANKIHAKIILPGDPKQLDAVTKSQTAEKLGYGTSFLEHLFNFPLYKRDANSGKFNAKYITQLVKNYRSHPVILHVPNQLFYDGVLKAESVPQIADLNIDLPKLNPDFPIIFKSVQGLCIQPDDDTSSYNVEEIIEVMAYIRTLLNANNSQLKQSDIGVISPYRLQCEFIRLTCKRNGFLDITVGTAEKFQGQERKIIIASTVCSRNGVLGSFVSDSQRLNVMLTRAQYLLIVVGDPHTLNTSPHWHEFIKYCCNNESLIQSDKSFMLNAS